MNHGKIAAGFSFVCVLTVTGCGNGVADDPLAGTWSNEACFGAPKPSDVESCTTELTFTNGLDFELRADWISLAATATNPGCTTTRRVTGQQWSTEHGRETFTVAGSGEATMQRSDCVNAEDDLEATATTDISIPTGEAKYTISGDTLSVKSGPLEGSYTR